MIMPLISRAQAHDAAILLGGPLLRSSASESTTGTEGMAGHWHGTAQLIMHATVTMSRLAREYLDA